MRKLTLNYLLIIAALIVVVALAGALAACGSGTSSGSSSPSASPVSTAPVSDTYKEAAILLGTNVPPGAGQDDWHTDQVLYDSATGRLYLTDSSNWAVDVWDINTSMFVAQITGFSGPAGANFFNFDQTGPNGLALDNQGRLWVGDGDGSVKVIDTKALKIIATIPTGAKNKADVVVIDSADGVAMVTCPAEGIDTNRQPFAAFIDLKTLKLLGTTPLTGAVDVGGALYSSKTGKFYVAVTSNGTTDSTKPAKSGGLLVIDPKTRQVTQTIPLGKMVVAGACWGPGTQVLVGSATEGYQGTVATATFPSVVVDVATGKIVATLPAASKSGRGIDGVAYDPGAKQYYLCDQSTQTIWVVDGSTFKVVSNIPTGDMHQLGADTALHHLFVPVNYKGLEIWVPSAQ